MKLLQKTFDSPARNLALDEALLEQAEQDDGFPEVLRLWEPPSTFVVLGRSSPHRREVNLEFCQDHGIPVLRRCSGGQTVVTGPGCLMYAVLLSYERHPELRMLEKAHRFVMTKMQEALQGLGVATNFEGTSDLTLGGKKFSGNALRCKRDWLVYHGTMICDLDLSLVANCLGRPIREPEYRKGREHLEFLTRLDVATDQLADSIQRAWNVDGEFDSDVSAMTELLMAKKYENEAWHTKV